MEQRPLDHVGVAVRDLELATDRYHQLLGTTVIHEEEVTSQKVRVRFLKHQDQKIELLQATAPDSPIARFLERRGEGIHHLAFRVDDIQAEMQRLRQQGFEILQEEPIRGAFNKLIFFIHPRSMGGTLVEICQPIETD